MKNLKVQKWNKSTRLLCGKRVTKKIVAIWWPYGHFVAVWLTPLVKLNTEVWNLLQNWKKNILIYKFALYECLRIMKYIFKKYLYTFQFSLYNTYYKYMRPKFFDYNGHERIYKKTATKKIYKKMKIVHNTGHFNHKKYSTKKTYNSNCNNLALWAVLLL